MLWFFDLLDGVILLGVLLIVEVLLMVGYVVDGVCVEWYW